MDTLVLNPNLAYLVLAAGLFFSLLAALTPGTGILEVVALFALLASGWAIYTLPVNLWALVVLLLSAILFVWTVYRNGKIPFLLLSMFLAVAGSVFLFRGETLWQPAVHPVLAFMVSLLTMGFFWVAARKVMAARSLHPAHGPETVIGQVGEAKTDVFADGSVQVAGELWSARSEQPIARGSAVRVTAREGFVLVVAAYNPA